MPKKGPLPQTFEHSTLGVFDRDKSTGDYVKKIRLGKHQADLVLNCGHEPADQIVSSLAVCARIASRCLTDPLCFTLTGAEYAAEKLLPQRNRDWLGDNERPLTKTQFLKRLKLDSISIDRDGGALWFDDGDVFWGHVVVVRFGPRGGFNDASVEG